MMTETLSSGFKSRAHADLRQFVASVASGTIRSDCLKRRREGCVLRAVTPDGMSVIVKLWIRPGWRGTVRRLTRTNVASCEWRAMRLLRSASVPTPEPLGIIRLRASGAPYTDAVCFEDLGECEGAMDYFKRLLREQRIDMIKTFDNAVIDMTARMTAAGVIDSDHGLHNMVLPNSGELTRLDLESARTGPSARRDTQRYGAMLGRMLATYTFAVQPDCSKVFAFAQRLVAHCRPNRSTVASAVAYFDNAMDQQFKVKGIDSRVSLVGLTASTASRWRPIPATTKLRTPIVNAENSRQTYSKHYQNPDAVEAYDTIYDEGTRNDAIWRVEQKLLARLIRRHCDDPAGAKTIDFACGTGRVTKFLSQKKGELVGSLIGVDISPQMLERARTNLGENETPLLQADIVNSPETVPDECDLIVSFRFLLLAEPSLRVAVVSQLAKKLKMDGVLIFSLHGNPNSFRFFAHLRNRLFTRGRRPLPHFGMAHMRELAAECGLKVVDGTGCGYIPNTIGKLIPIGLFRWLESTLSGWPFFWHFGSNLLAACKRDDSGDQ